MQPQKHCVGIFWDIENCAVPSGMPATTVASALLLLAKPPKVLMQFQCCADMTKVPRAIKQALSHANGRIIFVCCAK